MSLDLDKVIRLHIVDSLHYKQIAELLGTTYRTISYHLNKLGVCSNLTCMTPSVGYRKCPRCRMILSEGKFYSENYYCCSACASASSERYGEGQGELPRLKAEAYLKNLQRLYGLTEADVVELQDSQKGCCKICGESFDHGKIPHVDHNHVTGKVRGLLCRSCNVALGMFKDNPTILGNAKEYLITEGHYNE